jgi:hypothetical protein
MHPYRWYPRYPSRTLWFILGAASAALWIKHREGCRAIEGRRHCVRQQSVMPAPHAHLPPAGSGEVSPNLNNKSGGPQSINICQTFSRTIDNTIPADGRSFGERKQMERWEEEKEKLADFTLKATDAVRITFSIRKCLVLTVLLDG